MYQSEDTPYILGELPAFARESGFPLPSTEVAERKLRAILESHLALVAVDEAGRRLGFILGYVAPHHFWEDWWQLTELLFWVGRDSRGGHAGLRGGRVALALLDAFVDWGRRNVDRISFATSRTTNLRAAALERRGFQFHEAYFVLDCRATAAPAPAPEAAAAAGKESS